MLSTTILLNIKSALQKNMTMMKHSKKNLNSLDNISLGFDENNERIFTVLLKELSELHPEMQKDSALMKLKRKIMLIHPKGTIAFLKEWLGEIGVSQEIIKKSIKIIKKNKSQSLNHHTILETMNLIIKNIRI